MNFWRIAVFSRIISASGLTAGLGLLLVWSGVAPGCRTAPPLPVVDTGGPGWRREHFAALWRPPGKESSEVAGDLWMTRHADGRVLIHFAKLPFPTITGWRAPGAWQMEFQPQGRVARGNGVPPGRYLLLWVPEALEGRALPKEIAMETPPAEPRVLRLWHRRTGEAFTLFRRP